MSHAKEEADETVQPAGNVAERWKVGIRHIVDGDGIAIGNIVQTLGQLPVEFVFRGALKSSWHGWGQVARVGG